MSPTSARSYRSNCSEKTKKSEKDKKFAPSYVKFYKYEGIKQRYDMQNTKDKMRMRMQKKMREQNQAKMDNLHLVYRVDPTILENLFRAETSTLLVKNAPLVRMHNVSEQMK